MTTHRDPQCPSMGARDTLAKPGELFDCRRCADASAAAAMDRPLHYCTTHVRVEASHGVLSGLHEMLATGLYGRSAGDVAQRLVERGIEEWRRLRGAQQ